MCITVKHKSINFLAVEMKQLGDSSVEEHLLCMHESLGLLPITTKESTQEEVLPLIQTKDIKPLKGMEGNILTQG